MVFVKFVKRNIRRTPYQAITASMVMFLTFLVITIFLLLTLASQRVLHYFETKPQAIAFFRDGTTESDINAIKDSLESTGKVTQVKYVSKEDALQIYRDKNKDQPMMLELVTANILPASLDISTKTPQDLITIASILQKEPALEDVVVPKDVVQNITKATSVIRWIGGSLVVFLIAFATLVILMVIGFKIRIRRNEIETMKLLGASNWFIRMPFIVEGMFYGAVGAVYAWLISLAGLWYFSPLIERNMGDLHLYPLSPWVMGGLLLLELFVALLIGAGGSYAAVRRYLRF